jgi:hypothetical protein
MSQDSFIKYIQGPLYEKKIVDLTLSYNTDSMRCTCKVSLLKNFSRFDDEIKKIQKSYDQQFRGSYSYLKNQNEVVNMIKTEIKELEKQL